MIAYRDAVYLDAKHHSISLAQSLGDRLEVIAADFDDSLDSIERILSDSGDLDEMTLHQHLLATDRRHPLVQRVIVIDANGDLMAESGNSRSGSESFADRDYFIHHRDNETIGTRVGTPIVGRLTGRPSLPVTRRVEGPDGRFLGVIGLAVDLDTIRPNLLELTPRNDSVIAVFHEDGTMLLRAPDPEKVAGRSFLDYPLFSEHLPRRDAGFFLAENQSDGTTRYVAYTRLQGRSIVIAVAVSRWEVFAPWRNHVALELVKLFLVDLTGVALGLAAMRADRARRKVEANADSALDVALATEKQYRSVLDALPANVVMIDDAGFILMANAKWHQFADANDYRTDDHGVGLNYLELCEKAVGADAEEAEAAAQGIRMVLDGTRKVVTLEYPCHSPEKARWFKFMVGTINLGDLQGAVIMHIDITARKLAVMALESERARLSGLAESVPGVIFRLASRDGKTFRWVSLSPRCAEFFGVSNREVMEGNELLTKLVPPADMPSLLNAFSDHFTGGEPLDVEFPIRRADGMVLWLRALANVDGTRNEDGEAVSDGIFLDITSDHANRGELDHLRTYDTLTGLPNRTEFLRHLAHMGSGTPQGLPIKSALLLIGIDDFADINEAYGIAVGDSVLQAVAARLRDFVRSNDLLARVGGDIFAIAQGDLLTDSDAATLAEKAIVVFNQPVKLPGQTIRVSVSIGIGRPEGAGTSAEMVLNNASSALRRAKEDGRGVFRFDVDRSGLETQTRVALREGLAVALQREEFELHFQPRVRTSDGVITGGEALLRWNHATFGMQSPGKFIPVAERSGQIVEIGEWALNEACRQTRGWLDAGHKDIRIAVNVSAIQLRRTDFVSTVEKALSESGVPPGALEIELTEAAAFDRDFGEVLKRLRELGLSIAIDDFGTGYSSLSYLRRFPIDVLKIDQSFIRQSLASEEDEAMVRIIIGLARSLGIATVAEGVELAEQLSLLQRLGCDEIQGFFFAPPMPPEDFGWFLSEGHTQVLSKLRGPSRTAGVTGETQGPEVPVAGQPNVGGL